MALIDKIFSFKGNRQFSEAEELLIDALNDLDDFIADEAFINYTNTAIFAIDKELKQFLKLENTKTGLRKAIISFDEIESYQTSIKDRLDEEWMENFSRWSRNKKFIRSITISIQTKNNESMLLDFFVSENKDGDRASTIPVKRALFSVDKWDEVLYKIIDERFSDNSISE